MQIVSKKLLKMFDHKNVGTKIGSTTTAGLGCRCTAPMEKVLPTKHFYVFGDTAVQARCRKWENRSTEAPRRRRARGEREPTGNPHGCCSNILEASCWYPREELKEWFVVSDNVRYSHSPFFPMCYTFTPLSLFDQLICLSKTKNKFGEMVGGPMEKV